MQHLQKKNDSYTNSNQFSNKKIIRIRFQFIVRVVFVFDISGNNIWLPQTKLKFRISNLPTIGII